MATSYDLVTGDTASVLRVNCRNKSDKTALDLTACTVALHWINKAGTLVQRTMAIDSPATAGIVSYQFATGEIEASSMKFEVQITNSSGKILTLLNPIELNVRREIG
jgi:hypothetical protein